MKTKPQLYIPQTHILDPRNLGLEPEPEAVGFFRGTLRAVNEEERTVEWVISSGQIDRYGEIVDPKAFDKETIDGFMTNPIMLAGHQHIGFAGEATMIGNWLSIKREGDLTVGVAKLATTDLAEDYWRLILDGVIRACSIGFIVREWEMREIGSGEGKHRVRVFTKIELIEISLVAVPANREALMKAAGFEALSGAKATTTSGDGDESIDELRGMLAEALAKRVLEDLKEYLNTDPGGPLACLIQDVVEACQVARDHTDDAHISGVGAETAADRSFDQKVACVI